MEITIIDWQKFNPRTDSKNHTWFRFENEFYIKTFSWSAEEQRLFSYLCCCMSKAKKDSFFFDLNLAVALLKVKASQIQNNLKTLSKYGVVTISNSELLEVTSKVLVPTIRTNDTNDTKRTIDQSKFDLESLYASYPRKIGKKKGIEKLRLLVKTQQDFDLIKKAISNYSQYCSKHVTDSKFIKHFSTFMVSWEDHLEPITEFKNNHKVDIGAILGDSA